MKIFDADGEIDTEYRWYEDSEWHLCNSSYSENYWSGDAAKEFYGETKLKKISDNFRVFEKSLDKIDDDLYQVVFGDHVKVTITRKGVEIEDYDHD